MPYFLKAISRAPYFTQITKRDGETRTCYQSPFKLRPEAQESVQVATLVGVDRGEDAYLLPIPEIPPCRCPVTSS